MWFGLKLDLKKIFLIFYHFCIFCIMKKKHNFSWHKKKSYNKYLLTDGLRLFCPVESSDFFFFLFYFCCCFIYVLYKNKIEALEYLLFLYGMNKWCCFEHGLRVFGSRSGKSFFFMIWKGVFFFLFVKCYFFALDSFNKLNPWLTLT